MIRRWGALSPGILVLVAAHASAQGHRRYEVKGGSVEMTDSMMAGS